jgi:hypothetical protein
VHKNGANLELGFEAQLDLADGNCVSALAQVNKKQVSNER